VDPAEALNERAREYEVLAASHAERAPLGGAAGGDGEAATAFTVVAIVLREVACALEDAA
jgi:hypothetical protein